MDNQVIPIEEIPENLRKRMLTLFGKLDSAYPDKVIRFLSRDHETWAETVTDLYRKLGYPDGKTFLESYGYTVENKSGRPKSDISGFVNTLKERYPDGAEFETIGELLQANPDLASQYNTFKNQAQSLYGTSAVKYLVSIGIINGKPENDRSKDYEILLSRYSSVPFEGTITELKMANSDLSWENIGYCWRKSGFDGTLKEFLVEKKIVLKTEEETAESRLSRLTEELKQRYPEGKGFAGSLDKLAEDNKDLPISQLHSLSKKVFGIPAKEYLYKNRIMQDAPENSSDIDLVIRTLKEFYKEKKIATGKDIEKDFPDIKVDTLRNKVKKIYNKNLNDFLMENDILVKPGDPHVEYRFEIGYYVKFTDRELVERYFFAKTKTDKIKSEEKISMNPEQSAQAMIEVLKENKSSNLYILAAEFCLENKDKVSQETIDTLYLAATQARAKKAAEILSFYTGLVENKKISKQNSHPIEAFCELNFTAYAIDKYIDKLNIKSSLFKKVKYRDTDVLAPEFVVKCALVPYMKQLENNKPSVIRNYKKDCVQFRIDAIADRIAAELDRESLMDLLDDILGKGLPSAVEIVVPYGRYADGKRITALKARLRHWGDWSAYGVNGRKGIIIAHGAITLNDTREGMMIADKLSLLWRSAHIRGVSEEVIRDTVISDFGFDSDGKKRYDLGSTVIEVSMGKDLSVKLYDTSAEKEVKSVPKKGTDEKAYELAAAEITDMKKNIKSVIKNRVTALKNKFTSGVETEAANWKMSYIKNPVLNKVATLVVWAASQTETGNYEFTFMLKEDGTFITSDRKQVEIDDSMYIWVANPVDMYSGDIEAWKNYLSENAIAQPFTQIFEPVYTGDFESLKTIYSGIKLPFYAIKNLEKEGFELDGNRDWGYEVKLGYDICLSFWPTSPYSYSLKMISAKDEIQLGDFKIHERASRKKVNHAVYIFNKLCIEGIVKTNMLEQLINMKDHLNEKNILSFIDIAEEAGSMDCLVWLMNYKNEHIHNAFDDLEL